MLNNVLQKIGLSDKDSEVYLACLELGTQPASVIAKKAGLKRPTTYLILEGLLKKGLVSEYTGSNVKYFTAVAPEYLLNYIDKQRRELTSHQRELEEYLPQLQSLSNPYTLNPKVRFYEGMAGIERVMNDTLTSTEPLRCFSTIKSRKYLEDDYSDPDAQHQMSHFRWLPSDISGVFYNEINIYDNKMAIACLGKNEMLGIIIESESIANTQKSIFEVAWRAATPSKWELNSKKK
ncbi:MAG: Transcriptional regulator, TrmB [Candidatus Peregrinibacteria bacterium GW2011_GWA2_47_7]|nr:MAG: Transcriptional regulator, TrmB [Candidatus Peregrinibacteria bacterium GW2011_GWA2_47_7]